MRRRNPAGIDRFPWPDFGPAPTLTRVYDGDTEEWSRRFEERNARIDAERAKAAEYYNGVITEILRGASMRLASARRDGAFELGREPAKLGEVLGATYRDIYAVLFGAGVIAAHLYEPGHRLKVGGRGGMEFEQARAMNEQIASLGQRYLVARGRLDARPERRAAGALAFQDEAGRTRARNLAAEAAKLAGIVDKAFAESAGGDPLRAAKTVATAGPILGAVTNLVGWTEAIGLLGRPSVTKLKGAVSRMEKLAEKGEPEAQPDLAQLEALATEGELNAAGAAMLRRARAAAERAAARIAAGAEELRRRRAQAVADTRETFRMDRLNAVLDWLRKEPRPTGAAHEVRDRLSLQGDRFWYDRWVGPPSGGRPVHNGGNGLWRLLGDALTISEWNVRPEGLDAQAERMMARMSELVAQQERGVPAPPAVFANPSRRRPRRRA